MKRPNAGVAGSINTAYTYDATPVAEAAQTPDFGWAPAINRLIARRHQFLPVVFDDGVLFRALASGWRRHCRESGLGLLREAPGVAAQEADLAVMLMTHELSDALAVARLWEAAHTDAAILVLDAGAFAAAVRERHAGVLGFAEAGIVFRYPFMVPPLPAQAVRCVITASTAVPPDLERFDRITVGGDSRSAMAHAIGAELDSRCLRGAVPRPSALVPGR